MLVCFSASLASLLFFLPDCLLRFSLFFFLSFLLAALPCFSMFLFFCLFCAFAFLCFSASLLFRFSASLAFLLFCFSDCLLRFSLFKFSLAALPCFDCLLFFSC